MQVLKKTLTKTDIEKRLSIPTEKKKCFLDFTGSDKVEFKAMDKNGEVWCFVCSKRKKKTSYPKPVISKGWLRFVHKWKLAIGDIVILELPKTVKGPYRILVIRNANQPSEVLPTPVKNRNKTMGAASYGSLTDNESAVIMNNSGQSITYYLNERCRDKPKSNANQASEVLPSPVKNRNRTMGAASYGSLTDNESAVIMNNSGQSITHYRNERCRDKPKSSADSIDTELRLTSISLGPPKQLRKSICRCCDKPQSSADSIDSEFRRTYPSLKPQELICIDFFASESQHRGEKEQPTFLSIRHMVESPITVYETPYFEFL